MRSIVILGSALISSAAAAEAPAPAAPNPSERVCVVVSETGTRLGRVRRCGTRAQWVQQRRDVREAIASGQVNQINPQNMGPAERAVSAGRNYFIPH